MLTASGTPPLGFHSIHFSPRFGGNADLLDVVAETAAVGFDAIGLDLDGIDAHAAGGGTVDDVAVWVCDAPTCWSSYRARTTASPNRHAGLGQLARAVGAGVCIAAVASSLPWRELVAALRRCAEILADFGCRLGIEFTPYSALPTLRRAVQLCDAIGWSRAGVVVDAVHFFRSGAPWEDPASLGTTEIAVVQWNDAPAQLQSSLIDESRNHRLLPGDGALRLADLAGALRATGYGGTVVAEVLAEARLQRHGWSRVGLVHEQSRRLIRAPALDVFGPQSDRPAGRSGSSAPSGMTLDEAQLVS